MQNIKNKFIYLFRNFFSAKEIIWIGVLALVSVFSLIALLYYGSTYFMTDRIIYTGNMTEGIVDSLKNTNPYLPATQGDKDLGRLLFSPLIKNLNENSFDLVLAKSLEVSNDKQIYKVTLRENIFFSDGTPITTQDVIHSIETSTTEKNFTVEETNENTLTFKLKKPGVNNFLETFTVPITSMKEKFDSNISVDLITSSSLRIKSINKDKDGNVTKIILERYNNGEEKVPYLKTYTIVYFKTEAEAYNAFQKKEIDLLSGVRGSIITKIKDDQNIRFELAQLPNNFAIFINQNQNELLRDNTLRKAMSDVIDRESLSNQVLGDFGIPLSNLAGENKKPQATKEIIDNLSSIFSYENGVLYASTNKKDADAKEKVVVSITTIDNEELTETATFIQNAWKKIGIETEIKVIERNELNAVVKDRDFQNLLFGFSIKTSADYYSFFSGKERSYPKLNISNYTSINADKVLDILVDEKDEERKKELVKKLSAEVEKDNPVIVLYKPQFVFAHFLKSHIKLPNTIKSEEDRYQEIAYWYTNTEKVLKIWSKLDIVNYLDTYTY